MPYVDALLARRGRFGHLVRAHPFGYRSPHMGLALYVWSFSLAGVRAIVRPLPLPLPLAALLGRLPCFPFLLLLGPPQCLGLELVPVALNAGQPATPLALDARNTEEEEKGGGGQLTRQLVVAAAAPS